jgi:hypothetical protein
MSSNPTLATAAFKLSSQQERAWLQYESGVPAVAQCVIALEGNVNGEKLQGTLQHLAWKMVPLFAPFCSLGLRAGNWHLLCPHSAPTVPH